MTDSIKLLMIEDEESAHEFVLERLKAKGFECISAFDGKTGLELARQEKPDLIILDIKR